MSPVQTVVAVVAGSACVLLAARLGYAAGRREGDATARAAYAKGQITGIRAALRLSDAE